MSKNAIRKGEFREMGMDPMERLYYERQAGRKKSYDAKKSNNGGAKKSVGAKRRQMEEDSARFADRMIRSFGEDY